MIWRLNALLLLAALPSQVVAQVEAHPQASADTTAQVLPTIEVRGATTSRYSARRSRSATKTDALLRDVPQSVTVVTRDAINDQAMQSMGDVVRYVPGITMGQGEGNRDQPTIRGNNTTAGFFVDGMRDDVQYFRDLYNVERVEALKGANALIFGRGVGGGVLNRVTKLAEWIPTRELQLQGGSYGDRRTTLDVGQGVSGALALRLNAMYENSDRYRTTSASNATVSIRRRRSGFPRIPGSWGATSVSTTTGPRTAAFLRSRARPSPASRPAPSSAILPSATPTRW